MLCAVAAVAGAGGMFWWAKLRRPRLPDPPAVVMQMREVARLETLDVTLYKKVSFEPEPVLTGSLPRDLGTWAKFTLKPPKGKAIVFADVHLGLDFGKLDTDRIRVRGEAVDVSLPALQATVELRPGDTEVLGSNLDSQQTAQLLQVAKEAFEQEAMRDEKLKERARQSAERAMRGLILSLGFREVRFVDRLDPVEPG